MNVRYLISMRKLLYIKIEEMAMSGAKFDVVCSLEVSFDKFFSIP